MGLTYSSTSRTTQTLLRTGADKIPQSLAAWSDSGGKRSAEETECRAQRHSQVGQRRRVARQAGITSTLSSKAAEARSAPINSQVKILSIRRELLSMQANIEPDREPMIKAIARLQGKVAPERQEPNRGIAKVPEERQQEEKATEERRQDKEG